MKQCPICDLELSEPIPPFCKQCAWDLKNDLTLVPSLSLPEPVIEEYTQRYRAAKRVWKERLEAVKRQEEWEKRFEKLESAQADLINRLKSLEKSGQTDLANRLKSLEEAVKDIIPPPAGTLWTEPLTGMEFVYVPAGIFMMAMFSMKVLVMKSRCMKRSWTDFTSENIR